MQNLFNQGEADEQTGPRVVATVQVSEDVREEVLAGAVSRETAIRVNNYPLSKYKAIKGEMYYWLARGKRGEEARQVRLMHCSKDPRRRAEGDHYNDTTYTYVLVLVRIVGGEKDGHIEPRRPYGYMSREQIGEWLTRYGAALDEYQRQWFTSQMDRAEADPRGEVWVS